MGLGILAYCETAGSARLPESGCAPDSHPSRTHPRWAGSYSYPRPASCAPTRSQHLAGQLTNEFVLLLEQRLAQLDRAIILRARWQLARGVDGCAILFPIAPAPHPVEVLESSQPAWSAFCCGFAACGAANPGGRRLSGGAPRPAKFLPQGTFPPGIVPSCLLSSSGSGRWQKSELNSIDARRYCGRLASHWRTCDSDGSRASAR